MKTAHASTRELAAALQQSAQKTGETSPSVRGADWRTAIVTAIGSGTVTADGITCRCIETYTPAIGDVAVISQSSNGNWIAQGRPSSGTGWTAYTPTWTGSTTNPTIGNGTLIGRYQQTAGTVTLHINVTAGSTTNVGAGGYSFALPVRSANAGCTYVGNAQLLGGSRWGGQFVISPNQLVGAPYFPATTTNPRLDRMSTTVPEAFGDGDQLRITVIYEAAA